MNLSPAFHQVITLLHSRLQDAAFPWAFTGSLGMVLQGMQLEVHDIDVQTDRDGAYAIQALFSEKVTHAVAFSETDRIRSHYGGLEIAGVKVEIIGDVQTRPPGGDWFVLPRLPDLIRWVRYRGLRLPVVDLGYECGAYARMGREEKAVQIRRFLDQKIACVAAILYNESGQVLLQQRDDKPGLHSPGFWTLWGGRVEKGETPDQAICRELHEELELVDVPLTWWRVDYKPWQEYIIEQHVYTAPFNRPAESLTLHEGQALRYFSRAELRDLPIAFYFEEVLEAFFEEKMK